MPAKRATAFTASEVQKTPRTATGGRAVPESEFIKTTLVLRRKTGGGANQRDVDVVYDFLAAHHLSIIEGSTRAETLRTRLVQVGATLRDYQAAGVSPGTLRSVKRGGVTHRTRSGSLQIPKQLHPILLSWTGFSSEPGAVAHSRFLRSSGAFGIRAAGKSSSFTVPKLAALYGFPTGKLTGKGQSIAIIELNTYDSATHRPTGTGYTSADMAAYFKSIKTKMPTIVPVGVLGGANVPGTDPNADGEVALDIEVAGAVAPEATIVVYFAPNTDRGFVNAIHAAVFDTTHQPSIISISWGSPEDFSTQQYRDAMSAVMQDAADNNVTIFAAAGDSGSSDLAKSDGTPHADFPGSSDKVISCGGLRTQPDLAESIWNDGVQNGSGGGGVSNLFKKPAYQAGLPVPKSPKGFTGRGVPDVSANADPQTGYLVFVGGQQQIIGGTSAVAPLYAGLFALINQSRASHGKKPAGFCHPTLYGSPGAFRDIVVGNNDMTGKLKKYQAATGWDPCSGLGSPIGGKLLASLK